MLLIAGTTDGYGENTTNARFYYMFSELDLQTTQYAVHDERIYAKELEVSLAERI